MVAVAWFHHHSRARATSRVLGGVRIWKAARGEAWRSWTMDPLIRIVFGGELEHGLPPRQSNMELNQSMNRGFVQEWSLDPLGWLEPWPASGWIGSL